MNQKATSGVLISLEKGLTISTLAPVSSIILDIATIIEITSITLNSSIPATTSESNIARVALVTEPFAASPIKKIPIIHGIMVSLRVIITASITTTITVYIQCSIVSSTMKMLTSLQII